jgi:murein L,D-transpeptidase YcbB/YkuD
MRTNRPSFRHFLGFLSLAALVSLPGCRGGSGGSAAKGDPRLTAALKARFTGARPDYAASDPKAWKQAQAVYASAGYVPLWTDRGGLRPEAEALEAAIARAPEDGLNPANYDLQPVKALGLKRRGLLGGGESTPEKVAEAEARLSFVYFALARDLQSGRVEPGQVDKHWFGTARDTDLGKAFPAVVQSGDLGKALSALTPQHPEYLGLKKALARYREIAAHGGWPAVPVRLALKPGESRPEVATLRARLAASGDLSAAGSGTVFDPALREAVKRFERRHGLPDDGILDAEAVRALNVPVAERIRQMELNLERWRWLPEKLGEQYVLVNIPTFHLTAFDQGRPALEMRIVAGKKESPTPIFSDQMTTVVFSPYWNVPPEIARDETIPAAMRDPDYLAKNNIEMVSSPDGTVRYRQRPGPGNALGQVKFIFPNNFDVYLHDTPADSLFARVDRDYSHGCVRVEQPTDLARWVLRHQPEWTPERIQAAMNAGEEKHVALETPIPVYIVYETVWVDGDGTVQFRDDVYGHDAAQDRLLPPSPAPLPANRVASN